MTIKLTLDASGVRINLEQVKAALQQVTGKSVDLDTAAAKSKISELRDGVAMWGLAIRGAVDSLRMIGGTLSTVIQPALEAEQGMSRVTAAIESTGQAAGFTAKEIAKQASDIQEAFAFDDDLIMNKLMTPLLTFTNITGQAFKDAQIAVLDMNRALGEEGGGLKEVAMQVGKALQDPIQGISALTRVGVSFSEAQKEQIKQMTEMGNVAGAQKLILAELNKEFGGQAAAYANGFAGTIARAKNALGDLAQSIGELVLPLLAALADAIRPIIEWFTGLDGTMKVLIITLPLLTAAWYKLVAAKVTAAAVTGTLTGAIVAAGVAVKNFLVTIGPVGWVLLGTTAAVTAYSIATSGATEETDRAHSAHVELKKSLQGVTNGANAEVVQFDALVGRLRELRGSTDLSTGAQREMKEVIKQLNQNYGEYVGNIDLEKGAWEGVASALKKARDRLVEYQMSKIFEEKFKDQVYKVAGLRIKLSELEADSKNFGIQTYQDELALLQKYGDNSETRAMISRNRKWTQEGIALTKKQLADAEAELVKFQKAWTESIAAITGTSASSNTGGGGAAATAVGDTKQAMSDWERINQRLTDYFESDAVKLFRKFTDERKVIEAEFAVGSQERRVALARLDSWYYDETAKLQAARNAVTLKDEEAYYEAVTFQDATYYEWKKARIIADIDMMDLVAERRDELKKINIAALDAEKAAWDARPVTDLIEKYKEFKSEMATSRQVGVAAWADIRDGLIAFKTELENFKDLPGVAEILAKIQGEIEIAQLNAGKKSGDWFWSGLLGFDPASDEDKEKIAGIKATFRTLSSQISSVVSGMIDLNRQKRDEELAAIDVLAEKEKWSEAETARRKQNVNKKFAEEERKYRNIQKMLSITQAVINTAEGVTKALTLGPILGPIMAGVISALGAVQIGIIKAQKFAQGGLFRGAGGPRDDANLVMLSDGEFVVNAEATRRFFPLLSRINDAGNGRKESNFTRVEKNFLASMGYGGRGFNPMIFGPGFLPASRAQKGMYASGGLVNGGLSLSGLGDKLDTLGKKLDIINKNLVDKETGFTVFNAAPDVKTIVERNERVKAQQIRLGKDYRYAL